MNICTFSTIKALVYSVGLWGIMGQYLTMHMGAASEGIGGFNKKFGIDENEPDIRLSNRPTWTVYPAGWCEYARKGLEDAIAHRPIESGRDIPSIEKWRDELLVKILRLHDLL
jgi:hypothetical protein